MNFKPAGYFIGMVLCLILSGCATTTKIEQELTVLSGNISLEVPSEVPLPPSSGCLFDIYGDGNNLRGSTRLNGSVYAFAIDLETKTLNVFKPDTQIPHPIMRYALETRKAQSEQAELWRYDFVGKTWLHLTNGQLEFPTLSDKAALWAARQPNELNILGYDFETDQPFTVTTGSGFRAYPKISNNWVAYLEYEDIYTDAIRAYNLATKEVATIGSIPTYESVGVLPSTLFDIDQTKIVWRTFEKDIYVYDLTFHTKELIVQGEITDTFGLVDIADNLILWHKGIDDFRGYDLLNNISFKIPSTPPQMDGILTNFLSVRLTDSYVVWLVREDHRPDWALGTPLAPGTPTPQKIDPLVDREECNQRLFITPIIRK